MAIFRNEFARGGATLRARASCVAGLLAALMLPALSMSSCGGGAELLVVPFITFAFEGVTTDSAGTRERVQLVIFSSDNTEKGKTSGSLTANLQTASQTHLSVPGSYSGNTFSLSVPDATAPLAPAYSGNFVEPDTILLTPTTSGAPAITFVRADQSFRPILHESRWSGTDATTGQVWKVHFQTDPSDDAGSTEFLKGDDSAGGQPGTLSGYAVMRRIELDITRGAQTIHRSGRMGPAGQTPPASPPTPAQAQTMTFSDGSTLTRD